MSDAEPVPIHALVRARLDELRPAYEGRRVLVTGGLGFIGSAVLHQLAHLGAAVVNLDAGTYAANPANLTGLAKAGSLVNRRVDIADPVAVREAWRAHQPEVVLHLAAESHVDRSIEDPTPFLRTNVQGTGVLLDAARRLEPGPEVFVHISTDEVYGDVPFHAEPYDESAPFRASSPYAASKAGADLLAQANIRTYGLPVAITRGSNTYGPRQFPEKLIPVVMTKALRGDALPVYGDGQQRRDWLYVDDHARGILSVPPRYEALRGPLHAPENWAAVNIGFGDDIPNLELLERLLRAVAASEHSDADTTFEDLWALKTHVEDRKGHDRRYAMKRDRARDVLGWEPLVDLEAGLQATVDWYLTHRAVTDAVLDGSYQAHLKACFGDASAP